MMRSLVICGKQEKREKLRRAKRRNEKQLRNDYSMEQKLKIIVRLITNSPWRVSY
jgi:hypothetical protein